MSLARRAAMRPGRHVKDKKQHCTPPEECWYLQLITWFQWLVRMAAKWTAEGRGAEMWIKCQRRYAHLRCLLLAQRRVECEE